MRRPVVTIDAVHAALVAARNFIGRKRSIPIVVLNQISLSILDAHPGNDLALIVERDVGDLIRQVHVPMNARYDAGLWTATFDMNDHAPLSQCVLLVITITVENFHFVAIKLLGPVATLTSAFGWAQIVHRRWNRPRVLVDGQQI